MFWSSHSEAIPQSHSISVMYWPYEHFPQHTCVMSGDVTASLYCIGMSCHYTIFQLMRNEIPGNSGGLLDYKQYSDSSLSVFHDLSIFNVGIFPQISEFAHPDVLGNSRNSCTESSRSWIVPKMTSLNAPLDPKHLAHLVLSGTLNGGKDVGRDRYDKKKGKHDKRFEQKRWDIDGSQWLCCFFLLLLICFLVCFCLFLLLLLLLLFVSAERVDGNSWWWGY